MRAAHLQQAMPSRVQGLLQVLHVPEAVHDTRCGAHIARVCAVLEAWLQSSPCPAVLALGAAATPSWDVRLPVLLWVDVLIWKVDGQAVQRELHGWVLLRVRCAGFRIDTTRLHPGCMRSIRRSMPQHGHADGLAQARWSAWARVTQAHFDLVVTGQLRCSEGLRVAVPGLRSAVQARGCRQPHRNCTSACTVVM
jgi:hypothetical protein